MASTLKNYEESRVAVITNDGRFFIGTLKGYDQVINLVLKDCVERVYSATLPVEEDELGFYMIRGDNVAFIGEIDEKLEDAVNLADIRANPIQPVTH